MPSRSRSRSSAPTPAPRSLSGRPRGAVLVASALAGVECAEYAPGRSSRPCAATAAPRRRRCSGWCRRCSRCDAPPEPHHAADALAVAICHALAPPLLKAVAS